MISLRPSPPSILNGYTLSLLWPGLGHLRLGYQLVGWLFFVPTTILVGLAAWLIVHISGTGLVSLALRLLDPAVAMAGLSLLAFSLLWRLTAVVQLLLKDQRWRQLRPAQGRLLLAATLVISLMHVALLWYAWSFYAAGSRIFDSPPAPIAAVSFQPRPSEGDSIINEPSVRPTPRAARPTERMTWLLVGLDEGPGREGVRTDTILVFSADPISGEGVMVSFPRDIAEFPLYDGGTYTGKINSLYSYAQATPERYGDGGMNALRQQISFLLGVDIEYYASINLAGFERFIDLAGGVDVVNPRDINDPSLDGGFFLPAGPAHLDGEQALRYVRSRQGAGDSDFTRAARQQQVLLALRSKLLESDSFSRLPSLLDAASRMVQTNFPPDQLDAALTTLTDVAESDDDLTQVVLDSPYTWHPPVASTDGAWILRLDMEKLAQLSRELFNEESHYAEAD